MSSATAAFDLLHPGHVLHLQEARKLGDRLVVSVTRDAHVNKGAGRPVFCETHRVLMLKALRCVDEVILVDDALEALKTVVPDLFIKGPDYRGKIKDEDLAFCEANGIAIRFTTAPKWSSTEILDGLRRR